LKQIAEKRAQSPEVWLALGDLRLRSKRYADASQAFQAALDLTPYLLKAQLGLIECLASTGQSSAADVLLSEALKNNSRDRDVLAWRARLRRS
jgi:uncharacterized protein HemY